MKNCPVFEAANLIGKKWSIIMLQEISLNGHKGFNVLLRRILNIRPKVLSQRLKEFENMGLVKKITRKDKITRTEYYLTNKGKELSELVRNFKGGNVKYSNKKMECGKKACAECEFY